MRTKAKVAILALVVSITLLSGCSSYSQLNKQAFLKSSPRTIGLVIGHDIKAVSTASTETQPFTFLYMFFPTLLVTDTEIECSLDFVQQIDDMLRERVIGQMREKGFSVQLLCTNPTKWKAFENISDTADAYANLAKKHNLTSSVHDVDSILFFEYLLHGRWEGRFEELMGAVYLSVNNTKPMYAKSKVWLYDVKTGTRLFYKMVGKGYPSNTSTSIAQALDALVTLESIPATAE